MKTRCLILILLVASSSLFAADFRGSSWGDSKESVIKVEGTPSSEEVGDSGWNQGFPILVYEGRSLLDQKASVVYFFKEDSLVMARYIIGGGVGLPDYEAKPFTDRLTKALVEKYGKETARQEDTIGWIAEKSIIGMSRVKGVVWHVIYLDYYEKSFASTAFGNRDEL